MAELTLAPPLFGKRIPQPQTQTTLKTLKSPLKALNLLFKYLKTSSSRKKSNKSTRTHRLISNKSFNLKLVGGKKKFPRPKTFNTEKNPEFEFLYELDYLPHLSPPTTVDEDEERVVAKPWDENEVSTGMWSIGSIGDTNYTLCYCETVRDFLGDSPIIWDG